MLVRLLALAALCLAFAAVSSPSAMAVGSATNRTVKIKLQIKEVKKDYWKSRGVVRWYETRGKWALRPHQKKCRDNAPSAERVRICIKARRLLRKNQERIPWLLKRLDALEIQLEPVGNLSHWFCLYRHERHHRQGWRTNTGNGYFGGLQMDRRFMATYGADVVLRYGGRIVDGKAYGGEAHLWMPREQVVVAQRAKRVRGYGPWPNTGRACGLI